MNLDVAPEIRLSFGSMHFALATMNEALSGSAYLNAIEAALEEISGVEDVEIDPDPSFVVEQVEPLDESVADGYPPHPDIEATRIRIKLRISKHAQRSLVDEWQHEELGEQFELTLRRGWATGHAMIRQVDSPGDATRATIIVREFLRREFGRAIESPIEFQWIGPSPAHLEVSLDPRAESSDPIFGGFELVAHTRPAYDHYVFAYNATHFEDPASLADAFFDEIHADLDLYYRLVAADLQRSRVWAQLLDEIETISAVQQRPGLRGYLQRSIRLREPLSQALVGLAQFQIADVSTRNSIERDCLLTFGPAGAGCLKPSIDAELERLRPFPSAEISTLLQIFEQGRLTDRNVLAALTSSSIGIAIGAIVTLLASS